MFIKRIALVLAIAASTYASASDQHSNHSQHGAAMIDKTVLPKEPGQGAFAAIAEIVELLSNDPRTDWSKVRIDLLRQHLVDMNVLTLDAKVETTFRSDAVIFQVRGTGRTLEAIRRMVPAHAVELDKSKQLTVTAEAAAHGATLTISSSNAAERAQLKALGFFGVMAIGAHHREHHLSMAKGMMGSH